MLALAGCGSHPTKPHPVKPVKLWLTNPEHQPQHKRQQHKRQSNVRFDGRQFTYTLAACVSNDCGPYGITLHWSDIPLAGRTGYNVLVNGDLVGQPTTTTFDLVGMDCATTFTLGVQAHDAGSGTSSTYTTSYTTPACAGGDAPVNATAPKVTGVPIVNNQLSVSDGTWTVGGTPTACGENGMTCTYKWQDCNALGASCSDIGGATSSTYTMANTDTASSIQAVVTAHNASGDGAASGITGPEPVNFSKVSYSSGLSSDSCTNWGGTGSNTCSSTYQCQSGTSTCLSAAQLAQRYQWLSWGDITKAQTEQLKTDNPNVLTVKYIEPGSAGCGSASGSELIKYSGGSNWSRFPVNIGDTGYQDKCYATAASAISSYDYSGALSYWDSMTYSGQSAAGTGDAYDGYVSGVKTYQAVSPPATVPLNCPAGVYTYNSYACAMVAFITNAVIYAQAHGLPALQLPNVAIANGTTRSTPPAASKADPYWMGMSSAGGAALDEGFTMAGSHLDSIAQQLTPNLTAQRMSDAMWSDANGKYDFLLPYTDPGAQMMAEAPNVYALGAYLVTSARGGKGSIHPGGGYGGDSRWWPSDNTALQLGPASGAMQDRTSGSNHFYEQDFANGVAISNPSANSLGSIQINAGGGTYTGRECDASDTAGGGNTYGTCSDVTNASTVTMGATSGAVLLKTG